MNCFPRTYVIIHCRIYLYFHDVTQQITWKMYIASWIWWYDKLKLFSLTKRKLYCFRWGMWRIIIKARRMRVLGEKNNFRLTWVTELESWRNSTLAAFQGEDWHFHAWVLRSAQLMARWWQFGEKRGCQHQEHSGCIQMFSVGWDRGEPCLNKNRTSVKELVRTIHLNNAENRKMFPNI